MARSRILFGFALRTDITSIPPRVVAAPVYMASASIAIMLVAVGSLPWVRAWRAGKPAWPAERRRNGPMMMALAMPFLAAAGPSLYGALRRVLAETPGARRLRPWAEAMSRPIPLLVILAFLPVSVLFIMGLHRSYLHPRALMMFSSYVAGEGPARVWVVHFSSHLWGAFQTTTPEMTDALRGFRLVDEVETLRVRAELFVREAG